MDEDQDGRSFNQQCSLAGAVIGRCNSGFAEQIGVPSFDLCLVSASRRSSWMPREIGEFHRHAIEPRPDHLGFADHFPSSENSTSRMAVWVVPITAFVFSDAGKSQLMLTLQDRT